MKPIHHATVKRAARMGVTIEQGTDGFRLVRIEDGANSTDTFDSTAEALEALERNEVEFEAEGETFNRNTCGVMAKTYHDIYSHNPHGPGCGDSVDIAMREAITVMAGKVEIADPVRLKMIGEDNGLWRETWELLNVGMRRMNLANRIRGFLRNHPDGTVTIGGVTGRFGVEARAPKAKKG